MEQITKKKEITMNKKTYKENQPIKAMIKNEVVNCLFYDYFKENKCFVTVNDERVVIIHLDDIID